MAYLFLFSGRLKVKAAPSPSRLRTKILPPWASTICRAIASPMPEPPPERDLSAWLGNAMQSNALHELYRLEAGVRAADDASVLRDWRLLQTSDHFYYMCTKYFADGDVHKYFNPYESPYDSYINFMNVLDNIRSRLHLKRGLRLQKTLV